MRYSSIAGIAATVVAVALTACGGGGGDGGVGTAAEMKVGHLVPFTGANAAYAPASEKAGQLAIESAQSALEANEADAGVWTSGGTLAAANAVAIPQGVGLITPVSTAATLTDLEDDGPRGRELMDDPQVAELYLGGGRATEQPPADPPAEEGSR